MTMGQETGSGNMASIKIHSEETHLLRKNNDHNVHETGSHLDTGSQSQSPWLSNGFGHNDLKPAFESPPSTDDTVSIREDLSTGSIGESHGSSASASARAAHRQYLYPLRSKKYDGLRSSLLPPSGNSAHLHPHRLQSRSSSATSMLSLSYLVDDHTQPNSRDNVKWIKLRRINERLYSESGRRAFGTPTALAVSGFVAIGTSKGHILVFDYQQVCKHIIGAGTIAMEAGPVTALTISADHTCIAAGHQLGAIFSWDISKPATFSNYIAPVSVSTATTGTGHLAGVRITHLDFVGARHSAFVSADVHGMAFYHNSNRKIIVSQVITIRLVGRYPTTQGLPTLKPSTTYTASVLPLGTLSHYTDGLGLVAILTPYRLVIVSTAPSPRTQFKYNRPIGAVAESTDFTACAAWFPSVKHQALENIHGTNPILAFSWCRQLRILSIKDNRESSSPDAAHIRLIEVVVHMEHQVEDAIVAMQWHSRDILCLLTNTSKMQLLDATDLRIIAQCDLLSKHIQHADLYDRQLRDYFEQRESEYVNQRFADDFSCSFKLHKEKVFLLGVNDLSIGTVLTWSDKITGLIGTGQYIEALQTLISYLEGTGELRILGLPRNLDIRREKIKSSLYEIIASSIKHSLASEDLTIRSDLYQTRLLSICFEACYVLGDLAFIFERIHDFYEEADHIEPFLSHLGTSILNRSISFVPPSIMQQLVDQYSRAGLYTRLEDIICLVDARSLDVNQLSYLCKRHSLYNALTYVWNQVVQDFITPMVEYIELIKSVLRETQNTVSTSTGSGSEVNMLGVNTVNAIKVYSYLSLTLTGKVFPTGDWRLHGEGMLGKSALYEFLFSGYSIEWPPGSQKWITTDAETPEPTFPYLRLLLMFDCPTFLASMDEAFEDTFLNDNNDGHMSSEAARHPMTRQFIVNILLEVMVEGFPEDDLVYLYMFISRNVPKFSQFILLSSSILQRILTGLCHYTDPELAEDCQLSVEYLLSIFQPADTSRMIRHFHEAGFHRVLKSLYRSEKNWVELIHAHLKDTGHEVEVFACIEELFMPASVLSEKQIDLVQQAVLGNIVNIASLDGSRTAILINKYMPDSHKKIFDALITREGLLYIYLRDIFGHPDMQDASWVTPEVREKYIDLLCIYDRSHLVDYIKKLRLHDINYDRTIDMLETYEFVDAVIYLMSARGRTFDALQRISKQLQMSQNRYELADLPSTEVTDSITDSVVKYITIGMRLCETESQSVQYSLTRNHSPKVNGSRATPSDDMWVGLLESALGLFLDLGTKGNNLPAAMDNKSKQVKILLRKAKFRVQIAIQNCFTVLFSSTASHDSDSMVRILALLLNRPILKSHNVGRVRDILSDIFDSHQFHFSILALADSILATDLYLRLSLRNERCRRGWSVQSSTCILCQEQLHNPAFLSPAHKIRQLALEESRRERQVQRLEDVERRHGVHTNRTAGKKRAATKEGSSIPHPAASSLRIYQSHEEREPQSLPQTHAQPVTPVEIQKQVQIQTHAKPQTETQSSIQLTMDEDGAAPAFPHGTTLISYACGHLAHESCTQLYLSTYDNVHGRVHCTVCMDRQDETRRMNGNRTSHISDDETDKYEEEQEE